MSGVLHNPTVIVISDLHIADPKDPSLDEFRQDEAFDRLIDDRIPQAAGGKPATLVINGDFLDFVRVLPSYARHSPGDAFGCTEDESFQKLERMLGGHPKVFAALGRHLGRGGQLLLLAGNHDVDLYWPKVRQGLFAAVGGSAEARWFIPEGVIAEDGVFIQHGHQAAAENRFEHWEPEPIVNASDGRRLERPWGTLFLDRIYNDVHEVQPVVNRVSTFSRAAALAVRSLLRKGDEKVPWTVAAGLVVFLMRKGKKMLLRNFLLGEQTATGGDEVPTPAQVAQFLTWLAPDVPEERRQAVVEAARALLPPPDQRMGGADAGGFGWGESQLLGETEETGLHQHARNVLRGGYRVAAFGHTHVVEDGNADAKFRAGQDGRWFNTGCWLPTIRLADGESPTLAELAERQPTYDLRYLVIQRGAPPEAKLMSVPLAEKR
jgi:3',5'-cyclic AMP phosphodiesterase CpdA